MLGFVASGVMSVIGVFLLSKVHPELIKDTQKPLG
jgi:hypothetical protein